MTTKLNLSIAIADYDDNRPLIDGVVAIDGVEPDDTIAGGDVLPVNAARGLRRVRALAIMHHHALSSRVVEVEELVHPASLQSHTV